VGLSRGNGLSVALAVNVIGYGVSVFAFNDEDSLEAVLRVYGYFATLRISKRVDSDVGYCLVVCELI
jgi:hypothetical protein